MDERFKLNGISFAWNQTKAQENLREHGVAFEQAAEIVFDPFLRVVNENSADKARDAIIGMDERWNLLFVVHIAFEDESIRLISA